MYEDISDHSVFLWPRQIMQVCNLCVCEIILIRVWLPERSCICFNIEVCYIFVFLYLI